MSKRLLSIMTHLLVALFLSYYGSVTLFTHTHDYAWGKVTHSHPYQPEGAHSHSSASCQTIAQLGHYDFDGANVKLLYFAAVSEFDFGARELISDRSGYLPHAPLRAPPTYLL